MRTLTEDEKAITRHFERVYFELQLVTELENHLRRHRERLQDLWDSRSAVDSDVRYVEDVDPRLRAAARALTTEYPTATAEAELAARIELVVEDAAELANHCGMDLAKALEDEEEKLPTALDVAELALTIAVGGRENEKYGVFGTIMKKKHFGTFARWVEARHTGSRGGRPRKGEDAKGGVNHWRAAALNAAGLPSTRATRERTARKRTVSIP